MSVVVRRSKRKAAEMGADDLDEDVVEETVVAPDEATPMNLEEGGEFPPPAEPEGVVEAPPPPPEEHQPPPPHEEVAAPMEVVPEGGVVEEVPVEEGGPPVIKKPRKDIAEAAAKSEEEPTTTTTEEEIAKTMVEAHATAAAAAEEAMTVKPPAVANVPMVLVEEANNKVTTENGEPLTIVDQNRVPAESAEAMHNMQAKEAAAMATETMAAPAPPVEHPPPPEVAAPSIPMEAPKPPPLPKQEEMGISNNAIAAEAVAAMGNIPIPPPPPPQQQQQPQPDHTTPIYKKEQEEYEEPDDGLEIPEEEDSIWNARLLDLLLYKAQYRTLHVQATYDQPLHSWVDVQRRLYRRHRKDPKLVSAVTQTRLTALDAINFPFTLRGAAHWDRYYAKLQEFNKKHGHCLVPRLCEFAGLGDWVIDQRRQYKLMMQGKPSVLDPERQRKLEELGFVWVVRNRPEWNNRYQELLQYREKYGDTKVPQHYKEIPGLGKWVAKQREQYRLLSQGKHSFLTPDRLEKLNEAGFVWSVRKDTTDELKGKKALVEAALKKEVVPTIPVMVEEKPKDAVLVAVAAPVPPPPPALVGTVHPGAPKPAAEEMPAAGGHVVVEQEHAAAAVQEEVKKEDVEKKDEPQSVTV